MELEKDSFIVTASRKVVKFLDKQPIEIQKRFKVLVNQLAVSGPVAQNWPNYSKLGKDRYHCHLKHSYVACWVFEKGSIIIEVYYVGSREKAPY